MTKEEFIDAIKNMTVMELAELVKALEEEFGVSAATPVAVAGVAAAAGAAEAPKEEEKTEFNVVLKSVGDKKIQVIKVVRQVTDLGLKEAKELVEKAPATVKEGVSKEEAEKIKKQFEEVGATIEIE